MTLPVAEGTQRQLLHGCCEEARAARLTRICSQSTAISIALVANARRAETLAAECATFSQWILPKTGMDVFNFPEEPPPDIDSNRRADRNCDRLAVLSALLRETTKPRLLITTPEALLGPCPSRKNFAAQQIDLNVGTHTSFKLLIERLTQEFDYDAEALCEFPGQLAIRGGLLDIYPYDASQPYRLDFFGDEIESIRCYDPTTQRSIRSIQQLSLCAAVRTNEMQPDAGLIDYLPSAPMTWVLEEPVQLVRHHAYRFEKNIAPSQSLRTIDQLFAQRDPIGDNCIALCELDTDPEFFRSAPRLEVATEATAHYRLHTDGVQIGYHRYESEQSTQHQFEAQLADWVKIEQLSLCFTCDDPLQAEQIRARLAENPLTAELKPQFLSGSLKAGFIDRRSRTSKDWQALLPNTPPQGMALVTAHEFFGQQQRRLAPRRERAKPTISQVDQMLDFTELADGDPLVHLQHGICLFRGLTKLEIQGGSKEVISVEFAAEMTLHVPLHESHLLTRYVGLTKSAPKLGKVGGAVWDKTRRAAEIATLDYAAELLHLHARRDQADGYAFPPDTHWQREFENAFPFAETPDQLCAIEDTKRDMEQAAPMDRLICGDVGFGKTEVAIRAALKAVLAGKQVAVLVPTTVLCQQHYNTFRDRMAQYPVIIDQVSRFRTAAQNREILAQVAEGKIDIVIGTHRLLSNDVHFDRLGLLVVDEEQRFGVKQKDALKQLRAEVDILTLSATPIPRTLYLAMAGARSMSVIETPPMDRRPIETIVKSYDPALVKSAIQAETDRGGQVFYLHNRVASIEGVAQQIREMHPSLNVGIGHGQMEERQLEKVMTQFVAGKFDVLVCTTIIESGIDIPNCNTLIIEGADRFGLAQLYQIRGRVGRFKRQAYAYLLLHRHAALVDQAQKRLNALKQHNQLGAGFRIAMRDLELRGAGNLLGAQQSGHIAGVGFELYCQLLKQSVARLKGEPGADRIRAEVKLDFIASGEGGSASRRTSGTASFAAIKAAEYQSPSCLIEAALPITYIAEPRLRIDLYRRLALADNCESIQAIAEELEDRFGKRPDSVDALIALSEIRVRAELAGVRRVESERERLVCRLAHTSNGREFLKTGSRFPRLTAKDPLLRLAEIKKFLQRHART